MSTPAPVKPNWVIALLLGIWTGFVAFVEKLWTAILKIGKELWSLVSDYQWSFDLWKVLGLASFLFSAFITLQVLDLLKVKADVGSVGILAGLVGSFITTGTFLFGQSRRNDQAMIELEKAKNAPGGQ